MIPTGVDATTASDAMARDAAAAKAQGVLFDETDLRPLPADIGDIRSSRSISLATLSATSLGSSCSRIL